MWKLIFTWKITQVTYKKHIMEYCGLCDSLVWSKSKVERHMDLAVNVVSIKIYYKIKKYWSDISKAIIQEYCKLCDSLIWSKLHIERHLEQWHTNNISILKTLKDALKVFITNNVSTSRNLWETYQKEASVWSVSNIEKHI